MLKNYQIEWLKLKTCDYLLSKGYINRKQKKEVLKEQTQQKLQGVEVEIGQILLEKNFLTVDEIIEALTEQSREDDMPTEIGENTKVTTDFKFLGTIGAMIVSVAASYFSITGQIEELASKDSPNRLEHTHLQEELDEIKEMGDLKIISYKLDQYDNTFAELKSLSTTLQPLATDLTTIKKDLLNLKNKKIEMPDIDLSGIDECKDKLDALAEEIEELKKLEARVKKVEKSIGSKF